jgi:hypothetical protein
MSVHTVQMVLFTRVKILIRRRRWWPGLYKVQHASFCEVNEVKRRRARTNLLDRRQSKMSSS